MTLRLLCRALSFLSTEELARLLGQIPELEPATVNDIVRVIARARADANFRELLLSYLDRYLGGYGYVERSGEKVDETGSSIAYACTCSCSSAVNSMHL